MKREIAILLLFCFSFYHFGYYFFYLSYRYKIENDWTTNPFGLDREFDEEQIIKIPVHIPYLPDQEDFCASNASFVKNGASYRIIKQRHLQDALQVVYVPDIALNKLDHTIRGWITALTQGIDQETSGGKIIPKNIVKDYLQPANFLNIAPYLADEQPIGSFLSLCYPKILTAPPDPPPKTLFA